MKQNQLSVLSNLQVHTEKGILKNANVVIKNHSIHSIETEKISHADELAFPENYHLVPGFIDLHVHGADGCDVMDASQDALRAISRALAKEGTTGFLATTMTASSMKIEEALCAVRDFMSAQLDVEGAAILGVHLEGPFLSQKKAGAQREDDFLLPSVERFAHWQKISAEVIKLVTLAPELSDSLELIRYLKQKKIIASLGHTDATYAETAAAIAAGCTHATHLFNAMRGVHQREPGAVTAALLSDQVTAELIVDGVHLHPAIVEMAYKLKGKNRIALVTDSMRAKCLQDGVYDLGGQQVEVKNNRASLADGTLAGSVLKMSSAILKMMEFGKCSLSDAVMMAAENPAKSLGIFDRKGSIAVGKDADLVVLDDKLHVVLTMCGGRVVFRKL